jgi:hypothetical protein
MLCMFWIALITIIVCDNHSEKLEYIDKTIDFAFMFGLNLFFESSKYTCVKLKSMLKTPSTLKVWDKLLEINFKHDFWFKFSLVAQSTFSSFVVLDAQQLNLLAIFSFDALSNIFQPSSNKRYCL